jgi:hypothetical protein
VEDEAIRAVVTRLARPHASGGQVIERAALLAAGGDFQAMMAWIVDHDGTAEVEAPAAPKGGLHGGRVGLGAPVGPTAPARWLLPVGTLG